MNNFKYYTSILSGLFWGICFTFDLKDELNSFTFFNVAMVAIDVYLIYVAIYNSFLFKDGENA